MSNLKNIEEIAKKISESLEIPEYKISQIIQNTDFSNLKAEDAEVLLSNLNNEKSNLLNDILKTIR